MTTPICILSIREVETDKYQLTLGISTPYGLFKSFGWRCFEGKVYGPKVRSGSTWIPSVSADKELMAVLKPLILEEVAVFKGEPGAAARTAEKFLRAEFKELGSWTKVNNGVKDKQPESMAQAVAKATASLLALKDEATK